jgi:Aspartyl protease
VGRIRQTIKIDSRECWTLFDTGARNTYVIESVAKALKTSAMTHVFRSTLGGQVKETNTSAILEAEIEGHPIATHALVVDEIGKDENGKPIEILFGALAMQQWGIRPVPDEERLDLSNYPEEFVEFQIIGNRVPCSLHRMSSRHPSDRNF